MKKFWWADDTDLATTKSNIGSLRSGQLSNWTWVRWTDESTEVDPYSSFCDELFSTSMFDAGKVLYCYGLPDFHDKIAKDLEKIPNGVVLIIISRPNKTLSLYKRAKELPEIARVDEPKSITPQLAIEIIKSKAEKDGISIDNISCKMLIDFVGPNINRLDSELKKLAILGDNIITPQTISQGCFADGDYDVFKMLSCITSLNRDMAYEYMTRSLIGEHEMMIMGAIITWARALSIAEGGGRDINNLDKNILSKLKKRNIKGEEDGENTRKFLPIKDFDQGKVLGSPGKLIANSNSLFYKCEELSGKPAEFGYHIYEQVGCLFHELRTSSLDKRDLYFRLITSLIDCMPETPLFQYQIDE